MVDDLGYADGAHTDVHQEAADDAFAVLSLQVDSSMRRGRYLYFNLWRSIDDENPILSNHLAVLDFASLTQGVGSEVDGVESVNEGIEGWPQ